MFDALSDRLTGIFDGLKKRGALSEAHVTAALRDYVTPLMRGQAQVDVGPDGLPHYVRLVRHTVARKTGCAYSTER